jgi:hypothetical protein
MSREPVAVLRCAVLVAGMMAGSAAFAWSQGIPSDRPAPVTHAAADTDGAWIEMPPPSLAGHGAVFDSLRNRMITYDGRASGEVWVLQLGPGGGWSKYQPSGTPPPARSDARVVLEPLRDRMLVLGGATASEYVDVWALDLAGGMTWTEVLPTGTLPWARSQHSAIYDPRRDRVIVFGEDIYYGKSVWALNLGDEPAWELLSVTGPSWCGHTAIYDPVRDRMVVFAGSENGDGGHEVWALSLSGPPTWTQIVPPVPMDNLLATVAVYDPDGDRMIVMGGADLSYTHPNYLNLVFALSLGASPQWSEVLGWSWVPRGRFAHAGVYDPRAHRLIVHGGVCDGLLLGDTWAVNLTGPPA